MSRLRGEDGRILMLALDQAAVGGPQGHLQDPLRAVEALAEGSPDALLLTRGILRHAWEALPSRVGLVMRISGGFTVLEGAREFRDRVISTVEDSLRWGADAVAITVKYGHELEGEFIQAASGVADACDRWGVPLIVEARVALRGSAGHTEEEALAIAARAAAELGADLVALHYPSKGGDLAEATAGCPVPVMVLCDEKGGEKEVQEMVKRAVEDGAVGAVVGRSAWQHERPADLLERLHRALGRERTHA